MIFGLLKEYQGWHPKYIVTVDMLFLVLTVCCNWTTQAPLDLPVMELKHAFQNFASTAIIDGVVDLFFLRLMCISIG